MKKVASDTKQTNSHISHITQNLTYTFITGLLKQLKSIADKIDPKAKKSISFVFEEG
jgi:hypothetical protein